MAFLLQEVEIANTMKEASNKVPKELSTLTDSIQDALREITDKVITKLHELANKLFAQVKDKVEELGKIANNMSESAKKERAMGTPYQDALNRGVAGPPMQVNPQIRAKESIRARHFLWMLSTDVQDLKAMSAPQLLKHLNMKLEKATKMTNEECKLCSAVWLKNGGILVKASNNKLATWLCSKVNILHMECELETTILTKSRNYSMMVYFVPLTFDVAQKVPH